MFISYSPFLNFFFHPSKGFHAGNHVQVGTLLQRDLGGVAQFVAPQEASGTARAGCEQREGGKVTESVWLIPSPVHWKTPPFMVWNVEIP